LSEDFHRTKSGGGLQGGIQGTVLVQAYTNDKRCARVKLQ